MNQKTKPHIQFLQEFKQACAQHGKDPRSVTCVAVGKNRPIEAIQDLYDAGFIHFGENRLQEAQRKYVQSSFRDAILLHFLGPIQTNKITKIVQLFDCIQSVDSLDNCKRIAQAAQRSNKEMNLCLQLNLDSTKPVGFADENMLYAAAKFCQEDQHLSVKGVMGIASHTNNRDQLRSEFKRLYTCFVQLQNTYGTTVIEYCSMGMSGDFVEAIGEGSTMVRIGRKLFADG